MGIFRRIKSLFGGFFGVMTGKVEKSNPELLIADAEMRIHKSRKAAEKQLIEIQTWAEMVRIDMRESEKRLRDVQDKIEVATLDKDRVLLAELLIQEEEYAAQFEERKRLHESAVAEAIRVRDHFKHFESEIQSKLRELQSIKSQTQLARMRENIVALDNTYGSGNGFGNSEMQESMDRLRRMVNERCARVIATEQLKNDSTEYRISQIDHKTKWDKGFIDFGEIRKFIIFWRIYENLYGYGYSRSKQNKECN